MARDRQAAVALWVEKSHPHPVGPSAGVWRPVGARGHAAAVPPIPLGCSDPSQGLNVVWQARLEAWPATRAGEPRDWGPSGAGTRAISRLERGGGPSGINYLMTWNISPPLSAVFPSIKQTKRLDWPETPSGTVGEGQKVSTSPKGWGSNPSIHVPPPDCVTLGNFCPLGASVFPCETTGPALL